MNKFGARKVHADGHTFDSRAEHRRWRELKLLMRAGEIADLVPHPKYALMADTPAGPKKVGTYTPDFRYVEDGQTVVEDVKGPQTGAAKSDYRLRVRLLQANHPGILFREIGRK